MSPQSYFDDLFPPPHLILTLRLYQLCHTSKTNLLHKRHISEINPSNIIGNLKAKGIAETNNEREFFTI